MARTLTTMRPYSSSACWGVTSTVEIPATAWRISGPAGGAPSRGATRSCAFTSATSTRFPRRAASSASAAETVDFPTPPLPVTMRRRRSSRVRPDTELDKLASGGREVHMLRSFVTHPLLKKALAAGEEQFGKALGQVLSGDRAGTALQAMLAAAGQARERLDRA